MRRFLQISDRVYHAALFGVVLYVYMHG